MSRAHVHGRRGEELAAEYFEKRGWAVVARNYRHRRAEVDLIVRREDLLVFVEVKTRASDAWGPPESFVTDAQAERVLRVADEYLHEHDWTGAIRFDVVAVHLRPDGPELHHFEDAFY
ncbi:MAG: YraN family protein [Catalinimonas sp.]